MFDTMIGKVFARDIFLTVVVTVLLIGTLSFIWWGLKESKHFKLIIAASIAVVVIVISIMSIELVQIYLDIKNEDYITYQGEYIERGGGSQDLATVVVYDENGKEVRLLSWGPKKKGTFEGTVVYGKRSKIVVECNGIQKQ